MKIPFFSSRRRMRNIENEFLSLFEATHKKVYFKQSRVRNKYENFIIICRGLEEHNGKPLTILSFRLPQVTIPLQSFSNKTKCITNMNNCQENRKPPVHTKSAKSDEGDGRETITTAAPTTISPTKDSAVPAKSKDAWSSDDSILKSIDEDNKSTSSTVSSSSAFEDSTNLYSEKSESSMSSIHNVNENGKLLINRISADSKTIENCGTHDEDDSLEVLSSYDNDSGNDEFDEKGDRFNSFSYSSSDSRSDKKLRNYFNSLPLMRAKKHSVNSNFNSIRRKHFNNSAIDQEPFQDDTKAINLPSPSPSCGSWSSESNMLQQNLSTTKSSSVPILVKKDQFHDDFNKLTVSDESMLPTLTFFAFPFAARETRVLDHVVVCGFL